MLGLESASALFVKVCKVRMTILIATFRWKAALKCLIVCLFVEQFVMKEFLLKLVKSLTQHMKTILYSPLRSEKAQ